MFTQNINGSLLFLRKEGQGEKKKRKKYLKMSSGN